MAERLPITFATSARGATFPEALLRAQTAEAAGFDAVVFGDRPQDPMLDGWTLATAVAARTDRVRLFHTTLNVPYRFPQLIAKEAATLDQISGGRFDLCLGAAGQANQPYYEQYGIPFPSPGERLQDLRDAFAIIRGLWTNERFSYEGRRFHVKDAVCEPKPVNGVLPIWMGALQPRALRMVGELADGWMKNLGWTPVDELRQLNQRIDDVARAAGRDPLAIRRNVRATGFVAGNAAQAEEYRQQGGGQGRPQQGLIGTVEQILDTLRTYREAGMDSFIVEFQGPQAQDQLRSFGAEVIPEARRLPAPAAG